MATTRKRKKADALRPTTQDHLSAVRALADRLNGTDGPPHLRELAAQVATAILRRPYPAPVPPDAEAIFNRISVKATLDLRARALTGVEDHAAGIFWGLLLVFSMTPGRDRLHRCPICARWFVDETRGARQRRCSAKCMNAWHNALRKKRGRA